MSMVVYFSKCCQLPPAVTVVTTFNTQETVMNLFSGVNQQKSNIEKFSEVYFFIDSSNHCGRLGEWTIKGHALLTHDVIDLRATSGLNMCTCTIEECTDMIAFHSKTLLLSVI